jgi:LysM repeat protein
MTRLTNLGLGTVSVLVLAFGLVLWTPSVANAAPGGPEDGYGGEGSCSAIHKIAVGDTLTSIAAEHGISLEALIEANGIADANLIVLDQALCIPESDGPSHGGPSNGQSPDGPSRGGEYDEEYSSYGIPGQSYDPSAVKKQGGSGPEESYGPQNNGYGPKQEEYDEDYLAPGTSRPSYRHEDDEEYGEYGHEEESYGPSYHKEEGSGYGPKEESYSVYEYKGVPGKAYDPSAIYQPQPEPRYSPDDDDDPPGTNDNPSGRLPEEEEEPMDGNGGG